MMHQLEVCIRWKLLYHTHHMIRYARKLNSRQMTYTPISGLRELASPCVWQIYWTISKRHGNAHNCIRMNWQFPRNREKTHVSNWRELSGENIYRQRPSFHLEVWIPISDCKPIVLISSTCETGDIWWLRTAVAAPIPDFESTAKFPPITREVRFDIRECTSLAIAILAFIWTLGENAIIDWTKINRQLYNFISWV